MFDSRPWRGVLAAAAPTLCCLAALTLAAHAQDEAPMSAPVAEAPAESAAPAAITASGCLTRTEDGVLQLHAASVLYTLTAASEEVNLAEAVDHAVTVTGAPPSAAVGEDAPKALSVTSLKLESGSCGAPAAAPEEAPAPAAAPSPEAPAAAPE